MQNFDTLVRAAQRPGINAAAMAAGTLANGIAMSYEPLFDGTQRHSGIRTRSTIAGGIRARRSRTRRRTSPPAPGKGLFVADENGQRLAVGEIDVLHPRPAQPHHETLDSFATVLLEGAPWPPISTSITGMLKVLDSARPDASVSRRPGPASSGARVRRGETLATVYDR